MQDAIDTLQDATETLGKMFIEAVEQRNLKELKRLLLGYSNSLWGKYFNSLSKEDKNWTMQNLCKILSNWSDT